MTTQFTLDEFNYQALVADIAANPDQYDRDRAVEILRHLTDQITDYSNISDEIASLLKKFLFTLADTYAEPENERE